jgi:Gram-negative bacterial TonB protein C-terminal
MKKIKLISTILFSMASLAFGQAETANWKLYESPRLEFSVETPNKMEEFFEMGKDIKNDLNEVFKFGSYKTKFDGTLFFVFSEAILEKDPNNLSRFPEENLRTFIGENVHKSEIKKVGEHIGEFVSFKDSEGFYNTVLLVKSKHRSYIFHTISTRTSSPEIERFFDSIKLNENPVNSSEKKYPTKKIIDTFPANRGERQNGSIPNSAINIETFGGNDAGNASRGGMSGVPLPFPRQPSEPDFSKKSPLKIHSIIKPRYTTLARTYGIVGVVRLRVTFKSDATIGDVTVLSRLPLGLSNSAISAAKQLHFAPAKTDDVPQTVTKILEYDFSIE